MLNKVKKEDVRIARMTMNVMGINYLHRASPWVAAWWCAALPGFGHLYIGSYLKGIMFMTGEIFINLRGRINLAIFYTFIGNFEKANAVLNRRWAIFYMAVWVYSIYDAYMLAIETNKLCELEETQEKRYFERFRISTYGLNFLEQRPPWLAAFFSIMLGGSGQLYNFQFVKGIALLVWMITINYYSQFNHLFVKFVHGHEIYLQQVNWQWILFYPTIFAFCMWDSYVSCVELNKLFIEEQRYAFGAKNNFNAVSEGRVYPMVLLGVVKQSVDLELLVNSLKTHRLDNYQIVFLDRLNNNNKSIGDNFRRSDGISNFNGAMTGGAVLMLFGTMWGGPLIPGGPIAIGLAGFVIGGIIGYVLDRYIIGWIRSKVKLKPAVGSNAVDGEVLIMVNVSDKNKYDYVSNIFSQKNVRFVGELEESNLSALITKYKEPQ